MSAPFTRRAVDVTLTDFVIEGCLYDVSGTAKSIVDVEECTADRARGTIRLHRIEFRDNRLNGAAAIKADATSCSAVEVHDFDFRGNSCDGVCGLLLAKENTIRNVTIEQNEPILSSNSGSVIVRAPPRSTATVDRIRAFANSCPIFEIEGASLRLSNGSFTKNSETVVKDRFASACIKLEDASALIQDSTFEENKASYGAAINAQGSNITLKDCAFRRNVVGIKGTVLLRKGSFLTIDSSLFFSNEAEKSGGAIVAQKSELSIRRLTCVQNKAGLKGACLHVGRSSSLKLSHSALKNNNIRQNSGEGGAVWMKSSALFITDSTFFKNSAVRGGAMWIQHSVFSIVNCRFDNNSATNGSALVVQDCPLLQDRQQNEKCTVPVYEEKNEATGCGWVDAVGSLSRVTFVNNTAESLGGSVFISRSAVSFTACTFKKGEALNEGGFIYSGDNSFVGIHRSTLENGRSKYDGGCLAFRNAHLLLESTTLQNCQSLYDGGAADFRAASSEIVNSSILSNRVDDDGGGICLTRSNVTATGLIVKENEARQNGGGIAVDQESHLTIQDSIFENNNAMFGGAVAVTLSAVGKFTRVIFKDNFAKQSGGSLLISYGTSKIQESHFSNGSAVRYGGFIVVHQDGLLNIENVSMTGGKAVNGGAIALNHTTFEAKGLDVFRCEAKMGGAIKAKRSTVQCIDCRLRENEAKTEGGGIAFRSNGKQKLALLLQGNVMARNTARKGGVLRQRTKLSTDGVCSVRWNSLAEWFQQ